MIGDTEEKLFRARLIV